MAGLAMERESDEAITGTSVLDWLFVHLMPSREQRIAECAKAIAQGHPAPASETEEMRLAMGPEEGKPKREQADFFVRQRQEALASMQREVDRFQRIVKGTA